MRVLTLVAMLLWSWIGGNAAPLFDAARAELHATDANCAALLPRMRATESKRAMTQAPAPVVLAFARVEIGIAIGAEPASLARVLLRSDAARAPPVVSS